MLKGLVLAILVTLGALILRQALPDIRRYVKISTM